MGCSRHCLFDAHVLNHWTCLNKEDNFIVLVPNLSSRFLNLFVLSADTMSNGNLFHAETPLFVKNFALAWVFALLILSFRWWPLVLLSWFLAKNWSDSIFTCPESILKVSIRSPLLILSSTLCRFSRSKRSSYGECFRPLKGLTQLWKSRRIYPKYMPKCSVGSTNYVCNFLPKNIE